MRAWRAAWDRLPDLVGRAAPLLVHYDRPQTHFALLLHAGPRGVVTADPARGLELLSRAQFEARWSGVAAEVTDPGRPGLGRGAVEAAVAAALSRASLAERALSKPPVKRYFEGP